MIATFPGPIRAALVLDMGEHEEPAPIPQGLAPWHPVRVEPVTGAGEVRLDRGLYWEAPVAGVVGWGLVDAEGRLLWYHLLAPVVSRGDQVWVAPS